MNEWIISSMPMRRAKWICLWQTANKTGFKYNSVSGAILALYTSFWLKLLFVPESLHQIFPSSFSFSPSQERVDLAMRKSKVLDISLLLGSNQVGVVVECMTNPAWMIHSQSYLPLLLMLVLKSPITILVWSGNSFASMSYGIWVVGVK